MIIGVFALGFVAAVAILVSLARIETAQAKRGAPVIAVWLRRVSVSDGGPFVEAKPYARTLTGHGGHMGRDAALLMPRARLTGADVDDTTGLLTFHFQASATRWRVAYARTATKRPISGVWAPLGDLPTPQPSTTALRTP
jgi:hypothetical protein